MSTYTFTQLVLKKSTKKMDIFDENNHKIGSLQRFYKSKFLRIVDYVIDEFDVNVEVFNASDVSVVRATEVMSFKNMVLSNWKVNRGDGSQILVKDRTKVRTNSQYDFELSNKKYSMKKDFADKRVRLEDNTGFIHAEVTYDKIVPPQKISIKLLTDEVDVYLIACIYYISTLRR